MISAQGISYKVKDTTILHETSVSFAESRFHVIMGANGAGKSTLLKLLAEDIKSTTGKIKYGSEDLNTFTKQQLAQKRAVLSQNYQLSFPISVEEIVLMGRYPHFDAQPRAKDLAICEKAMALMEIEPFIERDYNTLSGGEAQKVQMSRVLAQIWTEEASEEKVLFLDEPVSHLDIKYQHQLLAVAKGLCRNNVTVIAILHDINLALAFADRILFMKKGRLVHDFDSPHELSTEVISEVFGIRSRIIHDPENGLPIVVF